MNRRRRSPIVNAGAVILGLLAIALVIIRLSVPL